MKKITKSVIVLLCCLFATSMLHAHEDFEFYVEPKLVYTMGEDVKHGSSTLEGEKGYGIGFDVGYIFSKYFGVEVDATYTKAKVKEIDHLGAVEEDTGYFYSYGVNSVFTYPMKRHLILLAKLGYMSEHEDLGDLHIKGSESGATWAAGIEYEVNEHVEISFEYEGADIRSVRGDSLQLGYIYKF